MTGNEDVVFSHLDDIFKKIIEATLTVVNKGRKKTKKVQSGLKFEQKPHVAPCGERDNATRPDAGAVLIDPVTLASILAELHTDSWFALAIPGEFKKKFLTETILDNVRKIMWSAKHILSDDPARRHVFAFTIDDTLMKLWFMSRSHIMVTEPFCFNSRPRELIRAISTFSLAKPEQLGFDSSISQVEIEETVQYKISLNGKVYVTICPLADYRADSIQGRSTRVWLVHPEGQPDVHYVLKDVWVPSDSLPEGDQLRHLHELLKSIDVPSGARHPSTYFLTVVDDGFVPLANGSEDDTLATMGGKTVPSDAECVRVTAEPRNTKQSEASGSRPLRRSKHTPAGTPAFETLRHTPRGLPPVPSFAAAPTKTVHRVPRKHYRIVFKEVGMTVYELGTVFQVMSALADITEAIKILSRLGLVHRDISPTNILITEDGAKLSDLEYLKPYRDDANEPERGLTKTVVGSQEDKTGTNVFMAVEVEISSYSFIPPWDLNDPAFNLVDTRKADKRGSVFRHTPLHDLESTFWIAIWMIAYRTCDGELLPTQANTWTKYFGPPTSSRNGERRSVILDAEPLSVKNFPPEFAHVANSLSTLRRALHRQYTLFQTSFDLSDLNLEQMLEVFIQMYTEAATLSKDVPPFQVAAPSETADKAETVQPDQVEGEASKKEGKRRRVDSSSDEDDEEAPTGGPIAPNQRPGPSKRVKQGTPAQKSGLRTSHRLAASAKNSKGRK